MAAKKPKRPKKGASLSAWENYAKKIKEYEGNRKKLAALHKKYL